MTAQPRRNRRYPTEAARRAVRSIELRQALDIAPFLPAALRREVRNMTVRFAIERGYPGYSRSAAARQLAADLQTPPADPARRAWAGCIRDLCDGNVPGYLTLFNCTLPDRAETA